MTDAHGIYWQRQEGNYCQPEVCEPPKDQNANNSRQAVWHLSREFKLEVFPEGYGWREGKDDQDEDGRYDRGQSFEITVCGVIQPLSSASDTDASIQMQRNPEGRHSEGQIVVHIDSHQQENLDAIAAAPAEVQAIFENGLRIVSADSEDPEVHQNHVPLIHFRGRRWIPVAILELFEAGDEELHDQGAVYRVVCSQFRDRNHERDALPSDAPAIGDIWGPTQAQQPTSLTDDPC